MTPEEYAAAGRVAGEGFGRTVATIGETHGAIAQRVFDLIGEAALPVRFGHDSISRLAYGSTRLLGRALLAGAGAAAGLAQEPGAPPADRSLAGRLIKGALSGAFGDALVAERNPLAVEMAVRRRGSDVAPTPEALAEAFPQARPRLAVFLHGLCETEDAWGLAARAVREARRRDVPQSETRDATKWRSYGARLRDELDFTPVYVRYNSGLHISDNGRRLAALLDDVVRAWPVEAERIVLIGHSMGGLVARSASHYGADSGWTERVSDVFSLGTPHLGAPLEQAAHAAACALSRLPETRPLATALNSRSVGIKDLGRGYLTDECWEGQDAEAFARHAAREIPFLAHANHYFVSASLTRDHDHRFGRHIGDLLVLHASAWGSQPRGERVRFPVDHYRHFGGATHLDLLGHPAIADQILRWLKPRELPAVTVATEHELVG